MNINNLKCGIALFALFSMSCASIGQKWKQIIGADSPPPPSRQSEPQTPSFATQPSMMVGKDRKYRRVTKDNFSEDQGLEDNTGSLWRKEGQGSYLFTQNNLRVIGDIVSVNVEGKTAENLDTKLGIIKQALARLEAPALKPKTTQPQAVRAPAGQAKTPGAPPGAEPIADQAAPAVAKDQEKMKFEPVPCRIVEKNPDGSYRVKGQQTVYVGRHEYRLVVTGILHADDVADGAIPSGKLLDSKFDLLASNKETRNDPIHY